MPRFDSVSYSIDPDEIARFAALADRWWDPDGPFKPLHLLNGPRMAELRRALGCDLRGMRVADIGCGGGLAAEALARAGARVTAIDAAPESVAAARAHARKSKLDIDIRTGTPESLIAAGESFDAVLALEVIEHVPEPARFVADLARLVRPGGALALATVNRTVRSWLLGVIMAERVLGWLDQGTHDWHGFLRPSELAGMCRDAGLIPSDLTGFAYRPLMGDFVSKRSGLAVNYLMVAKRPLC
ncbi:MAG: bifunctional 2-polyprenyl-6-hydroxyphenol methylase/3-demethylubiquinol 3-O-methyltransferase UbiG [Pseudomonadota bacterium]|nr:bifunctional 2-polyprenyl-6-hydroxyphenol methylase/3-demethylubiquinol 3-O-methyltransferase UbiG [Pseudomonadota bacterium]